MRDQNLYCFKRSLRMLSIIQVAMKYKVMNLLMKILQGNSVFFILKQYVNYFSAMIYHCIIQIRLVESQFNFVSAIMYLNDVKLLSLLDQSHDLFAKLIIKTLRATVQRKNNQLPQSVTIKACPLLFPVSFRSLALFRTKRNKRFTLATSGPFSKTTFVCRQVSTLSTLMRKVRCLRCIL